MNAYDEKCAGCRFSGDYGCEHNYAQTPDTPGTPELFMREFGGICGPEARLFDPLSKALAALDAEG